MVSFPHHWLNHTLGYVGAGRLYYIQCSMCNSMCNCIMGNILSLWNTGETASPDVMSMQPQSATEDVLNYLRAPTARVSSSFRRCAGRAPPKTPKKKLQEEWVLFPPARRAPRATKQAFLPKTNGAKRFAALLRLAEPRNLPDQHAFPAQTAESWSALICSHTYQHVEAPVQSLGICRVKSEWNR